MTQRALTEEEAATICMLIGGTWKYNRPGHYFYTLDLIETRQYMDADTMQPISQTAAWDRKGDEYGYRDKPASPE